MLCEFREIQSFMGYLSLGRGSGERRVATYGWLVGR